MLHDNAFSCIEGDATSEEALIKAGISSARGIVTVLPEDKDNLVVTFMSRQLNPTARIVSREFNKTIRNGCWRQVDDQTLEMQFRAKWLNSGRKMNGFGVSLNELGKVRVRVFRTSF